MRYLNRPFLDALLLLFFWVEILLVLTFWVNYHFGPYFDFDTISLSINRKSILF